MDTDEKLSAVERLENLLNEKDAELEELRARVERAEKKAETDNTWTRHRVYEDPKTAPGPNLPIPRLEIRWQELKEPEGYYEVEAIYSLVYKHLLGYTVFIPLGRTRSSGDLSRRVCESGAVDLPFRDGEHFRHEMKQLNLPGYGIIGDHVHKF